MTAPSFVVHRPCSIEEAVGLAARLGGDAAFLAGGTDLLIAAREGRVAARNLVSLGDIPGLRTIEEGWIGAMVRLAELARHAAMPPVLRRAARSVASPLVRNAATVGGNLLVDNRCVQFDQGALWREHRGACLKAGGTECHVVRGPSRCYAAASADLPPVLAVLGACVRLVGPDGSRDVPVASLYTGDGLRPHDLRPAELLSGVTLPEDVHGLRADYEKLRLRDAIDFPEVAVAAAGRWDGRGAVGALRVAVTGVGTAPLLLADAGRFCAEGILDDNAVRTIAEEVEKAVHPVKNTHFGPRHRRAMAGVLTRRVLARVRDGDGKREETGGTP